VREWGWKNEESENGKEAIVVKEKGSKEFSELEECVDTICASVLLEDLNYLEFGN
jgi:hypothetical protein